MSNIEFYYDGKPLEISVKGMSISPEGNVESINGGYGTFLLKPEFTKGKTKIIPIVESLINDSSEMDKQRYMEFAQFVNTMVDPETGKAVVNPKSLIEAGRGIMDKSVDIDRLLENKPTSKLPEDILKEAGIEESLPTAPEAQSPGFVPPEQRSGAPVLLPSSPNLGA